MLAECDAEDLALPVTAEDALAALDNAGIDRGVILGLGYFAGLTELGLDNDAQHRLTRSENEYIAEEVNTAPERLIGFFSVNPLADYAIEEIEYWAANSDLAGLKMHFANSDVDFSEPKHIEKLQAVFAALQRKDLGALVHLRNRNPEYGKADAEIFISEVLATAPGVQVTIAHFGGWGGYDDATQSAMSAFAEAINNGAIAHDQVTFGLDAVIANQISDAGKAALVRQMREVGLEQVVFGTDWDGETLIRFTPQSVRKDILTLGLTEAEAAQILTQAAPYIRN